LLFGLELSKFDKLNSAFANASTSLSYDVTSRRDEKPGRQRLAKLRADLEYIEQVQKAEVKFRSEKRQYERRARIIFWVDPGGVRSLPRRFCYSLRKIWRALARRRRNQY